MNRRATVAIVVYKAGITGSFTIVPLAGQLFIDRIRHSLEQIHVRNDTRRIINRKSGYTKKKKSRFHISWV